MKVNGLICKGHGVASGKSDNQRYPRGTLYEQLPYFKERGLDLSVLLFRNYQSGYCTLSL